MKLICTINLILVFFSIKKPKKKSRERQVFLKYHFLV